MRDSVGTQSSWLRCYRCWSQNLEVQLHYEGILTVDSSTGEAVDPVEEVQEAVVQCLDCLHDQPHLSLNLYEENGRRASRIEAVEDRWERMVTGTPWVASCTVSGCASRPLRTRKSCALSNISGSVLQSCRA